MSGAHMEPVDTRRTATTVTDDGVTLASTWQGHKSSIATGEPSIGTGKLGQAFQPHYAKAGDQIKLAADRVPVMFQGLGNAGTGSVNDYERGDGNAQGEMPQ